MPGLRALVCRAIFINQYLLLLCHGGDHNKRLDVHAVPSAQRHAVELIDSVVPAQGLEPKLW